MPTDRGLGYMCGTAGLAGCRPSMGPSPAAGGASDLSKCFPVAAFYFAMKCRFLKTALERPGIKLQAQEMALQAWRCREPHPPPSALPWMLPLHWVSNTGGGSQILPRSPQPSCQAVLNCSIDSPAGTGPQPWKQGQTQRAGEARLSFQPGVNPTSPTHCGLSTTHNCNQRWR